MFSTVYSTLSSILPISSANTCELCVTVILAASALIYSYTNIFIPSPFPRNPKRSFLPWLPGIFFIFLRCSTNTKTLGCEITRQFTFCFWFKRRILVCKEVLKRGKNVIYSNKTSITEKCRRFWSIKLKFSTFY